MKFILAKKIEMTQIWVGDERKAVTKVQAGPVVVSQLKTETKDGYNAVQVAFGDKKSKNMSKSVLGHLKNLGSFRYLKEFKVSAETISSLKVGDKIAADTFAVGDLLTITGWSKGRGFAGVVKRHGFHGQDKTHGNKDQLRMPGSIGAGGVQRVFKGVRMGGHMGDHLTTAHNIKVIQIDETENIIYVEGSIPGARGSLALLKADGELKVMTEAKEVESEKLPVENPEIVVEETAVEQIEPASAESSDEAKEKPVMDETENKESELVTEKQEEGEKKTEVDSEVEGEAK